MLYNKNINLFYQPKMAANWSDINYSKSPSKPKYFTRKCLNSVLKPFITLQSGFTPFGADDFYLAHTKNYVDDFLAGKQPLCSSNGLQWTAQFAQSVCYTNASLYYAIKHSIINPSHISVSPCCGFHHAMPDQGYGFCTFSGQVIASLKLYHEFGLVGAYIDLDGHFGNSIEDSREFCTDLNKAIPIGYNINPKGKHKTYIKNLKLSLDELEEALMNNKIHYIVYCHGADSHQDDDLGYQLTTSEWLQCSKMLCTMLLKVNKQKSKPIPFTYCLFGGYREDDYSKVIDLHYMDLELCFNHLTQHI